MIKLSGLSILSLKGATITTRTASKWGGAMIKLWTIYLSVILSVLV